jgi:hypothetical protein
MLLRFWGTRGSIPAPIKPEQVKQKVINALAMAGREQINLEDPKTIREFVTGLALNGSSVGSNTTCVSLELKNHLIIFDAGSGIRELGEYLMDKKYKLAQKFMSMTTCQHRWLGKWNKSFFLCNLIR